MSNGFARLLVLLLVATQGTVALSQEVGNSADYLARVAPYLEIHIPPGPGPFPVMILVTGCSGFHNERFSASYDNDADRFVELGYVVARADYIRAHGLQNSCSSDENPTGEIVPNREIANYIFATMEHMAARDDIDSDRIYLIGWSLGGTGILTALGYSARLDQQNIAAALNYFPGCDDVSAWTARVPMLLMLAEFDNINPPRYCRDLIRASNQADVVEVVEYRNSHHCFTASDLPIVTDPRVETTCAYNPEAHAASWQDILAFLETH